MERVLRGIPCERTERSKLQVQAIGLASDRWHLVVIDLDIFDNRTRNGGEANVEIVTVGVAFASVSIAPFMMLVKNVTITRDVVDDA